MNRSPSFQRHEVHGHGFGFSRVYSRPETIQRVPLPSPFQWNCELA